MRDGPLGPVGAHATDWSAGSARSVREREDPAEGDRGADRVSRGEADFMRAEVDLAQTGKTAVHRHILTLTTLLLDRFYAEDSWHRSCAGRATMRALVLIRTLSVLPFLSLLAACGGGIAAGPSDAAPAPDAGPTRDATPEPAEASPCSGDAPLCCPPNCAPLYPATCSSTGWTCPGDAFLLDAGAVCAGDCPVMAEAGPPSICPATYSVYGDTDPSDNLGHVDPRLYASGTCVGPLEQYAGVDAGGVSPEGGDTSTDLKVTLQESAPGSGMFVTVIHQTTPFPFDYTTCLESAGHGTGSAPNAAEPGTMALVNDPETISFPQVQLATNFAGTDLEFDVSLSDTGMFALNTVKCTYTKN
jgi:hypothetical protein